MFRRGVKILREEGPLTFSHKSLKFLSRRARSVILSYVNLPGPVLYWYFEAQSKVNPKMSDANPMDPIWVNPDRIQYYHSGGPRRFGRVASGDWDTPSERFDENIVYQSAKMRFKKGLSWSETDLYKEYYRRIDEDNSNLYGRQFGSVDELKMYFEKIDELYYSISENGYKTQKEILNENENKNVRDATEDNPHPLLNEITVNIYRNGELAKRRSGNHRLSIAKVHPDINKIPVLVRVRHKQWQKIRDEIRQAESPDQLSQRAYKHLDHPDLTGIVPNG